ncbi:sensor histidine kinase [Dermabacteraceae bacterium P13095]
MRTQMMLALLLAGLVGLVIGTVAMTAFMWSERRRLPSNPPLSPLVPEPVAEVLSIVRSAYVVLDSAGDVLHAAPLAYSLGLVQGVGGDYPRLATRELIALASRVGQDGGLREERMTLRRAHQVDGDAILDVRIGMLGSDRVLLLAEDRTREIKLEATRRDFVANVSHELKTPVGAISLLAETVEDAADDPDAVRRFAGRMRRESTRLTRLVSEIIELSRLQGGAAIPDASAVRLDRVVGDALASHLTVASARGIEVSVSTRPGLIAFGSAQLLTTAISNLIANAIAYSSPDTKVTVKARARGGMVEVSVSDQGIGISPENLERVFERFFRVDPARSRATGGTGLGLAIVKHIATDHGGEVVAQSAPGKGSTFTLRLPAYSPDNRKSTLASQSGKGLAK